MKFTNEISLNILPSDLGGEPYKSEIIYNTQSTKTVVSGVFLEQAVSWQDKFSLFLTDDCPFEEFLTIVLLDKHFNILDSARMGNIYSTGNFRNCNIESDDTLSFDFIGGTLWEIKLLEYFTFRIPFLTGARGVYRKFGFKQHFIITGNPQPDI